MSARPGHTWTEGKRAATKALLVSPNNVVGIQSSLHRQDDHGPARPCRRRQGTRLHRPGARTHGHGCVRTKRAIGGEPMTVSKMLTSSHATPCGDRNPEIWIVDEASMLSARDGKTLLAQAQAEGVRVVIVGDVK
ncbi:AAA family ATPase [Sphingomonas faeni]|uniref:AAA family ATPase n=1 Tax=Sphingomonas faeni TaxID=185950 RepID=UPI003358E7EE